MSDEKKSPATLVAILVAARRAGDRDLERDARQKLRDRFGIKLNFPQDAAICLERQGRPTRNKRPVAEAGTHAE